MTSNGHRTIHPYYIPKGRRVKGDPILLNDEACWIWQWDSSNPTPTLNYQGRKVSARRFVFEQERGPIADDHWLKPNCGQSRCVNPWHMDQRRRVSEAERQANSEARANKRLEQFLNEYGHELVAENMKVKSEVRNLIRSHIGNQPSLNWREPSEWWDWFDLALEVAVQESIPSLVALDAMSAALETEEGTRMAARHARLFATITLASIVAERGVD